MAVLRVLFVEDNHDDVELMKMELERANGFQLFSRRVDNEAGFRGALNEFPWDLIVCDYHMPTFDAMRALEILDTFGLDTPFILVSGKITREQAETVLRQKRVYEYVPKEDMARLGPLVHRELRAADMHEWALQIIADALEIRDIETAGHSNRVVEMTVDLARAMGISEALIVHYRRGALLHDIGKLGIPDRILLKEGPLTPDEWEIMRKHPMIAYDLLRKKQRPERAYLKNFFDIPHYHHERWDGSGYPHGLEGELIPKAARIFAVVDVFDALTTDRPYRDAWTRDETLEWLLHQRGVLFDAVIVNVFVKMMRDKVDKDGAP